MRKVQVLIAVLFALVAVAAVLERVDTSTALAPMTGAFTGEITPEGLVYRLPPIHVVADRKAALARIEREEQMDWPREVRVKTARKPNA